MARVKKTEAVAPSPKHWSEVKHGCCSCRFYKDDPKDKRSPCYPCTQWSHWEDANPGNPIPPQTIPRSVSTVLPDAPDETEPVLGSCTLTAKPMTQRTRKTAVVSNEIGLPPAETTAVPKKRPGRPKKVIAAPEDPISAEPPTVQPKKRVGRPRNKADEPFEQTASADTDQLSFGL